MTQITKEQQEAIDSWSEGRIWPESWVLNLDKCCYEPPKPYPTDGERYFWNENQLDWVLASSIIVDPPQ